MTIQELGSLGELIAAVATVITLAYLAVQIRSNTIVTKSEASRASRAETTVTVRLIAADDDLARIFVAGLADPAQLTPIESMRFRFLIAGFMAPLTQAYKEWQLGISDEGELLERLEQSQRIFSTRGGRWYWREQGAAYDGEMRDYLESHLHMGEIDGPVDPAT